MILNFFELILNIFAQKIFFNKLTNNSFNKLFLIKKRYFLIKSLIACITVYYGIMSYFWWGYQ